MSNDHTAEIFQAVVLGVQASRRNSCNDVEKVIGWILQYGKVSGVNNIQARAMLEQRLVDLIPQRRKECGALECQVCYPPKQTRKRYCLQNRCRDGEWKSLFNEEFDCSNLAIGRVKVLSQGPITYGRLRVVDVFTGHLVVE